jgi:hypothetical protein
VILPFSSSSSFLVGYYSSSSSSVQLPELSSSPWLESRVSMISLLRYLKIFLVTPPHPPAFFPWKSMVWEGMSLVYTAAAAKGLFSFGSFLAFTYFGE